METQETEDNPTGGTADGPLTVSAAARREAGAPGTGDGQALPPPVVLIIGFGLPGRFVAEVLDARRVPYAVIELNPSNAGNAAQTGKRVVCGDSRDPDLLRAAGIESARFLAVTLPDERAVIEVLHVARQVNPSIQMMARCNYTSTGIKAERAGAQFVLVEEQLVALEFARLMGSVL